MSWTAPSTTLSSTSRPYDLSLRQRFLLLAVAGAAVWIPTVVLVDDVIAAMLAFAPMVLVPLALSAVISSDRNGKYPSSLNVISFLHLPASVSLTIALWQRPGAAAGWLSVPWAVTSGVVALMGLRRLIARGIRWIDETALDIGCVYLAVGGLWTLIGAFGYQPMDFSPRKILLAAVHFHYAGFVLLAVGTVGSRVRAGRMGYLALGSVLVGVPTVAIGIAFSVVLEVAGAVLTVAGAMQIALEQILVALGWSRARLQRILLVASSAALVIGMVLALIHAVSPHLGIDLVVGGMVWFHGAVNGLGFAMLGLLGWALDPPRGKSPSNGIPFSESAARHHVGPNFFYEIGAIDAGRDVRGLTDSLDVFRRIDFPTERVHPAIRAFYEDTEAHDLEVIPHWTPGFRFLYRGFRRFAQRINQNDFPLLDGSPSRIDNKVLALKGDRTGLRAWIRTYADRPERAMYVAEYHTHRFGDVTYMDIAFPYPGGNLASILKPNPIDVHSDVLGFELTTRDGGDRGDAGIWFATRRGPIRLPLQERIDVWEPTMRGVPESLRNPPKGTTVVARHELRMFGLRYLVLDYLIAPRDG